MTSTTDNHDANITEEFDGEGNLVNTIHIDLCNEIADDLLDTMIDLQGEVEHFDFSVAAFGLFVNCVHILLNSGWSCNDLVKEVQDHAQLHDVQGETIN